MRDISIKTTANLIGVIGVVLMIAFHLLKNEYGVGLGVGYMTCGLIFRTMKR